MKKIAFLPLILALAIGCENKETPPPEKANAQSSDTKAKKVNLVEAKKLMEVNCLTCHQVQENDTNKIGPSISAIRNVYINEAPERQAFIEAIVGFAEKPEKEKVRLPGALQKFGVMAVGFPKEKLSKIASYIYETEFEKKGFVFKDYKKVEKEVPIDSLPYPERGLKYALGTKKVLGGNLVGALEKKGTDGALSFCNEKAIELTEQKSKAFGVSVKRVSDKPRNASNAANKSELEYIAKGKATLKAGGKMKPHTFESGDKVTGYYPIMTKPMCMQCHGEVEKQIKPSTLTSVKKLYPEDKAVGYGVDELRGIWVIEMPKDKAVK